MYIPKPLIICTVVKSRIDKLNKVMKKTLLVLTMLACVSINTQAQVQDAPAPGLTNIISDIRESPIFSRKDITLTNGGTLAGFQVAGEVFPEFPAIAINKVATDLVIDNEPCSVYLSFDGGATFLYLTTFYEPRRWKIFKEYPKLQVMALKVGTEPAPK